MTDADPPEPAVPIPPDIDDYDPEDAYRTGAKVMADLFVNAGETYRALLSEADDPPADDTPPDVCSACGADATRSVFDGASEETGEGYRCRACEG